MHAYQQKRSSRRGRGRNLLTCVFLQTHKCCQTLFYCPNDTNYLYNKIIISVFTPWSCYGTVCPQAIDVISILVPMYVSGLAADAVSK